MVRMKEGNASKVLMRRRDGRMLAGVCAGVADYFSLDVTLVRVIWAVVSVITGGAGVLAYLVAWIIIPDEGQKSSIAENMVGKKQDSYSG
jgi:phage shock protein PspC (stress-responsive transcriptional regulator)